MAQLAGAYQDDAPASLMNPLMDVTNISNINVYKIEESLSTPTKGCSMPIYCEICGSVDVLRDESGFFVCQDCGARYTAEAIRELIGATYARPEEPKKPVTIDEKIEAYFNEGDYTAAYELYDGTSDKDTLQPASLIYGGLATSMVRRAEGELSESRNTVWDICNTYAIALDKHADVLKREKVDNLLTAATLVFVFVGKVYTDQGNALVERFKARELDAEKYEEALADLDRLILARDANAFDVFKHIAMYVDDGYVPSEEQRKNMRELFDSTAYYNRTMYIQLLVKRLLETTSPSRAVASGASFDSLMKAARAAMTNAQFDVSQRLYEKALEKKKGDHEAEFFSSMLEGLARYMPFANSGLTGWAAHRLGSVPMDDVMKVDLGKPAPNRLTGNGEVSLLEIGATSIEMVLGLTKATAAKAAETFASEEADGSAHSKELRDAIKELPSKVDADIAEALYRLAVGLTDVVYYKRYTLTSKLQSDRWEEMYQRVPYNERDQYWQGNHNRFLKFKK